MSSEQRLNQFTVPTRYGSAAARRHGLKRHRLLRILDRISEERVGLVVGPAGSGKTTLLAHFADEIDLPVAWFTPHGSADLQAFVSGLDEAFTRVLGPKKHRWSSIEEMAAALDSWEGPGIVLIVDDLHMLYRTSAEAALELLLGASPTKLRVLMASRRIPGFSRSRMRVTEGFFEIDADDLRFRSWEVEQLFRDVYCEVHPPDELAELARRTRGWAAALHLFHLATRDKPSHERRLTLASLAGRLRVVHEYLLEDVLADLPNNLLDFAVRSSVLGCLSESLCDELLVRDDSREILSDLETRQLLHSSIEDDCYRYHDVIRVYLQASLVDQVGESEARDLYRAAATLLEREGRFAEALEAYSHAEDREAVVRLLGYGDVDVSLSPCGWIDLLCPSMVNDDAWVQLARGRRLRAAGNWEQAVESYEKAAGVAGAIGISDVVRKERRALLGWFSDRALLDGWVKQLRTATASRPLAVADDAEQTLHGVLVAGLAELLGGRLGEAREILRGLQNHPEASPELALAATVAVAIVGGLALDEGAAADAELAAEHAERLELPVLTRLARSALALDGSQRGASEAVIAREAFEHAGDRWGVALVQLFEGIGALRSGSDGRSVLRNAAKQLEALDAPVLAVWATSALALSSARAGEADARDRAHSAERRARAIGVVGSRVFAYEALAEIDPQGARRHVELAEAAAVESGIRRFKLEVIADGVRRPFVEVRCLGAFSVLRDGAPISLEGLKPRAIALLQLLCLRAGVPVHRDVLIETFWPAVDPQRATRSLHVCLSALRQLFQDHSKASSPIVRSGDAYSLELSSGSSVDVAQVQHLVAQGRAAFKQGSVDLAVESYEHALDLHRGELLPGWAAEEWIIREREHLTAEIVEAGLDLADLYLERDDFRSCIRVCDRLIALDRYRDDVWRVLMRAHERAGNRAGANQALRRYEDVLGELGLHAAARIPEAQDVRS